MKIYWIQWLTQAWQFMKFATCLRWIYSANSEKSEFNLKIRISHHPSQLYKQEYFFRYQKLQDKEHWQFLRIFLAHLFMREPLLLRAWSTWPWAWGTRGGGGGAGGGRSPTGVSRRSRWQQPLVTIDRVQAGWFHSLQENNRHTSRDKQSLRAQRQDNSNVLARQWLQRQQAQHQATTRTHRPQRPAAI